MRRYEILTKEEIIEFFLMDGNDCDKCPVSEQCHDPTTSSPCNRLLAEYLTGEIGEITPRITTMKNFDDFIQMANAFKNHCKSQKTCTECDYYYKNYVDCDDFENCFSRYLLQGIEV